MIQHGKKVKVPRPARSYPKQVQCQTNTEARKLNVNRFKNQGCAFLRNPALTPKPRPNVAFAHPLQPCG